MIRFQYRSLLLPATAIVSALALPGCFGDDNASYVVDCRLDPVLLEDAKQYLISEGDVRCRSGCDEAYVLSELADREPECDEVLLGPGVGVDPDTTTRAVGPTAATLLFEVSGSMSGYLAQQSGMRDHLADLVSRVRSPMDPAVDSLSVIFVGKQQQAYTGRLPAFAGSLLPGKLPSVGTSTSDIAALIDTTFAKADFTRASMLVSDLVLSPGKKEAADAYLTDQGIAVRDATEALRVRQPNAAVALVTADSDFDGKYYDCDDDSARYTGIRPYHYVIAGPQALVTTLAERTVTATGGTSVVFTGATVALPFEVQAANPNKEYGFFRVDTTNETPVLVEAEPANRTVQLEVVIHVDLSGVPGANTALDAATVTEGFELADHRRLPTTAAPYTHELTLRHDGKLFARTVRLTLPKGGVGDLAARSTNDCGNDPSQFPGQTFGLVDIVQGIDEAFANTRDAPAAQLSFSIQPE